MLFTQNTLKQRARRHLRRCCDKIRRVILCYFYKTRRAILCYSFLRTSALGFERIKPCNRLSLPCLLRLLSFLLPPLLFFSSLFFVLLPPSSTLPFPPLTHSLPLREGVKEKEGEREKPTTPPPDPPHSKHSSGWLFKRSMHLPSDATSSLIPLVPAAAALRLRCGRGGGTGEQRDVVTARSLVVVS
jgi:hypothetical protein